MADWQVLYTHRGVDRDIAGYWRNVKGTPVRTAQKVPAGSPGFASPMAGVYRYRFETSTTVSCARISTMEYANPLIFPGERPVIADGTADNLNLLSGWSVVVAEDARPGDFFEIGVGCLLDTDLATWCRILSFGPRLVGYPSTSIPLAARNASGVPLSDCVVVATNAIRAHNHDSPTSPFLIFRQTGLLNPFADSDPTGAPVSFAQYSLFGHPHKYADIYVNGEPIDIHDVTANRIMPDGKRLVCDGTTVYRFADGSKYQSGTFVLPELMGLNLYATLYVSDGAESVKIGNEAGNVVSGPAGLALTQNGEQSGRISVGHSASFEVRIDPTNRSAADLNARSFSLRLLGMDGDRPVSLEHQGSFVLVAGAAELNLRVNTVSGKYPRPHYSEDSGNPGKYVEDDEGIYVEDEQSPGTFILATDDPNSGHYGNYADYLSGNGITFTNA